jgi:hypothetical protein
MAASARRGSEGHVTVEECGLRSMHACTAGSRLSFADVVHGLSPLFLLCCILLHGGAFWRTDKGSVRPLADSHKSSTCPNSNLPCVKLQIGLFFSSTSGVTPLYYVVKNPRGAVSAKDHQRSLPTRCTKWCRSYFQFLNRQRANLGSGTVK